MLKTTPFGARWTSIMLYVASILTLTSPVSGLAISYCSTFNNAGSYPAYYSQYQSNGECQDHCQGSFAFAVLQGNNCWCSNYVPEPQQDTLECNQQCPGFPSEWCGSTDANLYGYFLLSPGIPIGTSGSASSAPSTSSSVSTSLMTNPGSSSPTPTLPTSSSSPSPSVITFGRSQSSDEDSYTSYSSATSTTSSSSTSSSSTTSDLSTPTSSTPSTTPTPTEVYTSVTTVTGEVRTVVVTPTASADATLGQSSTGGGGVNVGKIVGIVLGVVLGLCAMVGIFVFLWFRRRRQHKEHGGGPETTFMPRTGESSPSNNLPSRQVSQMSSSGLLGNKAPRISTLGMSQGNDPRSADTASSGFDRRSLATDQRLNPYALYIHDESRLSDVSLQDNQDYSRQLRVANPDA